MLGRSYTEVEDHEKALYHYEQTAALDPSHVLALSNAAQTAYFVFNRKETAARYLSQALALDSLIPMGHLILGFIYASENNFAEALRHYEAEIAAGRKIVGTNSYAVSSQTIQQIAALARFNLFSLYSQQLRDRNKAFLNYHEYLRLEQDGKKKSEAMALFRKYWGGMPR
jgi:tetratricopeptide (TPR) repeat protein